MIWSTPTKKRSVRSNLGQEPSARPSTVFTLFDPSIIDVYSMIFYHQLIHNYKLTQFLMEETEIDPEQVEKQRKMWKMFGMQTKAGKELFNLYNLSNKPKVEYPKVKPKSEK